MSTEVEVSAVGDQDDRPRYFALIVRDVVSQARSREDASALTTAARRRLRCSLESAVRSSVEAIERQRLVGRSGPIRRKPDRRRQGARDQPAELAHETEKIQADQACRGTFVSAGDLVLDGRTAAAAGFWNRKSLKLRAGADPSRRIRPALRRARRRSRARITSSFRRARTRRAFSALAGNYGGCPLRALRGSLAERLIDGTALGVGSIPVATPCTVGAKQRAVHCARPSRIGWRTDHRIRTRRRTVGCLHRSRTVRSGNRRGGEPAVALRRGAPASFASSPATIG